MAISDTKLRSIYGKPYSGPAEITDSDGLGIRITPKGVISFQFRFRWEGKQNRMGLGRYPALTLRDARNIVADLRESADKGIDPRTLAGGNKSKSKPTVKDCLDYWKENYVDVTLRAKTIALYKSTVIKHMRDAFPGIPVEDIPVRLWVERFTEEEKINPRRARHLLIQLRSAIGWCTRRQFISTTELMLLQPKDIGVKPVIGETTLSYNQLAKIWMAIERSRGSTSNRLLHQLLMLYGARNSELRLAIRGEFDREEGLWVVPAEKSKTNKIIRRPIFSAADDLLKKAEMTYGDILFPGEDLKTPLLFLVQINFSEESRTRWGLVSLLHMIFGAHWQPGYPKRVLLRTSSKRCWGMNLAACFLSITSMTGLPNRKTPMICMLKRYSGISGGFLVDSPV